MLPNLFFMVFLMLLVALYINYTKMKTLRNKVNNKFTKINFEIVLAKKLSSSYKTNLLLVYNKEKKIQQKLLKNKVDLIAIEHTLKEICMFI